MIKSLAADISNNSPLTNESLNDLSNLADVYFSLGELLAEQGHYKLSLEDYLKCLKIQKSVSAHSRIIAATYYSIGYVNELINNFAEAETQFTTAKTILKSLIDTKLNVGVADTDNEISSLEEFIVEIDCKLTECHEQINIDRKGDSHNHCSTKEDIAACSGANEDTDKGASLLTEQSFPPANPFGAAQSEFTTPTNITHQIRRKKRANDEHDDDDIVKKVKNK